MSEYEPQPGTLAFSARLFAEMGLMSPEEADQWKDDMKAGLYDHLLYNEKGDETTK